MTRVVVPLPYDFAEFERRARLRLQRRRVRTAMLRGGCGLSVLLAAVLAWSGTRQPDAAGWPRAAAVGATEAVASSPSSPELPLLLRSPGAAVVRVETRLSVLALEERIALVDDLLSDAQAGSDPLRRLQRLERERALLADSLRRVQHAEALLLQAEEPRPSLTSR
jgi:hypothetical protein